MKQHMIFVKSLILAAMGLSSVSCVQNTDLGGTGVPGTDEVSVYFRANMSGVGHIATRAADNGEFAVKKIDVLVFTQPSGTEDFIYQYRTVGRRLDQPGNTFVDFEAYLTQNTDPVKLLIAANCPDGLLDGLTTPGPTETVVREQLFTSVVDFSQSIPMTGVVELTSLPATMGTVRFSLIRSVAKTTVAVDLRADSPAFRLSGVTVYRTHTSWQLFPDAGNVVDESTAPVVIDPSIPDNNTATAPEVDVSESQFFCQYLAECPKSDENNAICIIVGGYYDTDDTPSYYRIDFGKEDYIDTRPMGQVLRNYWYRFTIVGVTARGYPSVEDAVSHPSTGLLTTVLPWNGGGNTEYYFGDGDFVQLTDASLTLYNNALNPATLVFVTSGAPFTLTASSMAGQQFNSEDFDAENATGNIYGKGSEGNNLFQFRLLYQPLLETVGMRYFVIAIFGLIEGDMTPEVIEIHTGNGLLTIQVPVLREEDSSVVDIPYTAVSPAQSQ